MASRKKSTTFEDSLSSFHENSAKGYLYDPYRGGTPPTRTSYTNIDTNTSVRPEYNRYDYDYFRPGESLPTRPREIVNACEEAYNRFPIIRHSIDLMSDFACQGIQINHPIRKWERLFREWFHKIINGKDRSERFLNNLYRTGNVFIYVTTEKLKVSQISDMGKTKAKLYDTDIIIYKNEIPVKYTFLNPLSIDIPDLYIKSGGKKKYYLRASNNYISQLRDVYGSSLDTSQHELPEELVKLIKSSNKNININGYSVEIPTDKLRTSFYKKDDWCGWAIPFLYPLLNSLVTLDKTELADRAALDGAISHVRLWKLGSLEKEIAPNPAAAARLARILENNVGSGTIDIIWGPDVELVESKTNIYNFLGSEKYQATLDTIHAGLGLPRSLTSTGSSGFTNNFVALQTLIKRLEYGRQKLQEFWIREFEHVRIALGVKVLPTLTFDHLDMSDPAAQKKLIIELVDRGIISNETALEHFGEMLSIEKARLHREDLSREAGNLPHRAGPFHISDKEHEYKKLFIPAGNLTPGQLGIELDEKAPGEITKIDMQMKMAEQKAIQAKQSKTGTGAGRPTGAKDINKRKQKTVKPRTSVKAMLNDVLSNFNIVNQEKFDEIVYEIDSDPSLTSPQLILNKLREILNG